MHYKMYDEAGTRETSMKQPEPLREKQSEEERTQHNGSAAEASGAIRSLSTSVVFVVKTLLLPLHYRCRVNRQTKKACLFFSAQMINISFET